MTTNSEFLFRSDRGCCIPGCYNREFNYTCCDYYTFPSHKYEFDRKIRWVKAVRKVMKDKSWMPNRNTRICSVHFVGGKKSSFKTNKAYVPKIFPETSVPEASISGLIDPLAEGDSTMKVEQGDMYCLNRQEQEQALAEDSLFINQEEELIINGDEVGTNFEACIADREAAIAENSLFIKQEEELIISDDELDTNFEACIADRVESTSKSKLTVNDQEFCVITEVCKADTEQDPLKSETMISIKKIDSVTDCCKASKDVNLTKYKPKSKCRRRSSKLLNAAICKLNEGKLGEVPLDNVTSKTQKIQNFLGLDSVADENELRQLTGLSSDTFTTLLKLQESGREHKTRVDLHHKSDGTQVRMLVIQEYKEHIKIENAMLLFLMKIKGGLSFSDLSRTFNILPQTAAKIFLIFLNVLADCTKPCISWPLEGSVNKDYPSIACIEVAVDSSIFIKPRIWMYSSREGVSTIKFLIAITSNGAICKVSKVFGGRVSNEYIATNDCRFSNFSEHKILDDIIPPEKIQVQNAIERVKANHILKHISMCMVPHLNAVVHMCCIFANSQLSLTK